MFFAGVYNETYNWAALFDEILQFSDKLIVLGDVPALGLCLQGCFTASFSVAQDCGAVSHACGGAMVKNEVYKRGIADSNFDFLTKVLEYRLYGSQRLKLESAIRVAASLPRFAGRVKFIELASYFLTDTEPPYMQLLDPITGGLVYVDANHLNAHGTRRLEQVFREEPFGQPIC
jgi:hypothetical protein